MRRRQLGQELKKYPGVEHLIRAIAVSDRIGQRLARRIKTFKVHTLTLDDDLSFNRGYYVTKANDSATGNDVIYHEETNLLIGLVQDGSVSEFRIEGDELDNELEDEQFHRPGTSLIEALKSRGPFDYVAVVRKTTRWEVERAYDESHPDGFMDMNRNEPSTEYSVDIYLSPEGSILGVAWARGPDGVFHDPTTPPGPFNRIRGLEQLRQQV